ncbi:unnamed protein product [Closterium sp. Yama58-4]|nr:unnamed protein product [Closterium sp. Yama58-4]
MPWMNAQLTFTWASQSALASLSPSPRICHVPFFPPHLPLAATSASTACTACEPQLQQHGGAHQLGSRIKGQKPTCHPTPTPPLLPCSDVSNNSLYGRVNRNFNSMVADGGALINLAHNFFYGDAVLFAAGCQVCPEEITQRNQLQLGDSSVRVAGMCSDTASGSLRDYSVAMAGKGARGSLAGNCLTLKRDNKCPSNATQRSTAACQAFCSITDNGPCDGHGACVPPAPDAPTNSGYQTPVTNFTCMCDARYSSVGLGNGSTCAILNSTTTAGEAPSHMHAQPSGD